MKRGKVKWFNDIKGYGYIEDQDGATIFVHFSVIEMEGYKTLEDGAEVEFEFIGGEKGPRATRVKRL